PAEQPVHQLARVAVLLKARRIGSRLVIEQHELGPLADLLEVAEIVTLRRDRSAVHPDPQAIRTAGRLGRAIVQLPDLDPPPVVPLNPLAVGAAVPILALRQ